MFLLFGEQAAGDGYAVAQTNLGCMYVALAFHGGGDCSGYGSSAAVGQQRAVSVARAVAAAHHTQLPPCTWAAPVMPLGRKCRIDATDTHGERAALRLCLAYASRAMLTQLGIATATVLLWIIREYHARACTMSGMVCNCASVEANALRPMPSGQCPQANALRQIPATLRPRCLAASQASPQVAPSRSSTRQRGRTGAPRYHAPAPRRTVKRRWPTILKPFGPILSVFYR